MQTPKSRRQFLGEASCASMGSLSILSSILNLKLANQAAASGLTASDDCKTLVCVLMDGGCDTFNLLVRRDNSGYETYADSRSDMALGSGGQAGSGGARALINLNQVSNPDSNRYGIHPSCPEIAEMFNGTGAFSSIGRRLSFVSNVGTLVEPITATQFNRPNNQVPVPNSLFSHIDQATQWQTSIPQGQTELTGWAGRMADLLHSRFNTEETAMSISLAGNNIFQVGQKTTQFAVTQDGALLPTGSPAGLNNITARKNFAIESLVSSTYNNMVQDALSTHTRTAIDAQAAFKEVFDNVDTSTIPGRLVNILNQSRLGRELFAAARTIKARQELGLRRNTIFIRRGGWDHHGDLLEPHAELLSEFSSAIGAYQQVLEIMGLSEEVVTYSASDFGRTLRSNGRGTDHAWGGNQMVWGAPVRAGRVLGQFPDLTLNSSDDIGLGGRMVPTTSTDKFFAEMASWFGVRNSDMPAVLPNLGNFSTDPDIGIIRS